MEKSPEEKLKQEKSLKTARTIWTVLVVLFGVLALFNLYGLIQGKDALASVLSQSGMVFVGLAILIGSRNKLLYYVFTALGVVAVFAGFMTAIMSLVN